MTNETFNLADLLNLTPEELEAARAEQEAAKIETAAILAERTGNACGPEDGIVLGF